MKNNLQNFGIIIFIVFILVILKPFNIIKVLASENKKNLTILFTHDLHDHFLPSKVKEGDDIIDLGGYERLKTVIDEEKAKDPNSILVDGGDFSMGTLFQSIYESYAPELKILGEMGYDVTTLGNHEFDFRAKGLTNTLNSALKSKEKLPQIVQSNMKFPKDKNGKLTNSLSNLKKAVKSYKVKEYTVIKKGDLKIGVFGLMGKDAASNAPMSEVEFTDTVKNAKKVVNTLKNKEKVDIILCASHSGIDADKSKSEDEKLAKEVPDIDVIISGHTHTKLNKPIKIGKTIIGCCGEYSENLGVIKLSKNEKGSWKLDSYKLKNIDSNILKDTTISQKIEKFKKVVQQKYLNKFGMKFDEVLAKTNFNFIASSKIGDKQGEEPLGNLISDAYKYAVKKAEGSNYDPVDVSIVPAGTIRGSFVKGNITVADVFTVSSLGIGKDRVAGYPLLSVYITGKELKTACEVDASISPKMKPAQIYMSGITYTFNPNRMILNKVTDAKLQKSDGTYEKIEDKKLYRVVAGLYCAQMLSVVGEKSYGLLKIVPKTKEGKPITNFEDHIIYDTTSGNNNEVKEWVAIAEYLKSFKKTNGISKIPLYYNKVQGRKIIDDNKSILAILSHPNKIALGVYIFAIILISITAFIIIKLNKYRNHSKTVKKGL